MICFNVPHSEDNTLSSLANKHHGQPGRATTRAYTSNVCGWVRLNVQHLPNEKLPILLTVASDLSGCQQSCTLSFGIPSKVLHIEREVCACELIASLAQQPARSLARV